MKSNRTDLFPFVLIIVLTLISFVIFWSVMDMVLLGASIAVVLLPLHHRILKYARPRISAAIVTLTVLIALSVTVLVTLFILNSNASTLRELFGAIGIWLNNPATNPLDFGIPVSKASLSTMLAEGNALFVDYQKTLISYLYLIMFKMLVLFVSIFSLLRWGEELEIKLTHHVPEILKGYIRKLAEVTADTLYAIYIVQITIAILTFFIALPVFYLLGYGNIIFYSFLAAFCELIPILGSSVAFILIGTYSLALGDTRGVFILFFLGYLIVSCVPEIYVRPVLVGRRVKIHPLIMFIGIISGILTMGLAGFVLGPVIIVLITTSYRMYVQERKDRQEPGLIF
jgi:predicted PurR-regulated permease PerM